MRVCCSSTSTRVSPWLFLVGHHGGFVLAMLMLMLTRARQPRASWMVTTTTRTTRTTRTSSLSSTIANSRHRYCRVWPIPSGTSGRRRRPVTTPSSSSKPANILCAAAPREEEAAYRVDRGAGSWSASPSPSTSSWLVAAVHANLRAIRQQLASQQQQQRLTEASSSSSSSSVTAQETIRTTSTTVWLLGVSGGSDSIALLHLLRQWVRLRGTNQADTHTHTDSEEPPPPPQQQFLHVVHFDHQQRGNDSDADRELVVRLCQQYGMPCHVYYWNNDANAHANANDSLTPKFSQETARNWRTTTMQRLCDALLRDTQRNHPPGTPVSGILLTAHHLDDSNETLLLKLLRGTHITHLQGMDLVTCVDSDGAVEDQQSGTNHMIWARPLLTVPKSALIQYLQEHHYIWRDDASNASNKYLRNRIRNELIPLLTDLVGGDQQNGDDGTAILQKRIDHLSQQSRDVEQHLNQLAHQYLGDSQSLEDGVFHIPSVLPMDMVAQQALHLWIVQTAADAARRNSANSIASVHPVRAIDCSYDQMQRLCRQLHDYPRNHLWRLDLGHQWSVAREGTVLRLHHPGCVAQVVAPTTERELCWTVLDPSLPSDEAFHSGDEQNSLILQIPNHRWMNNTSFVVTTMADAGALFFRPSWRDKALPLKDFLRGQKVPLHQRGQSPLVVWRRRDGDGNPTPVVAAVYVQPKQSWYVAHECSMVGESDLDVPIRVELGSVTRFD